MRTLAQEARPLGRSLAQCLVSRPSRLLGDRTLTLGPCGYRAIAWGALDRRVLAVLEFLVASGLDPAVSPEWCSAARTRPAAPAGLGGV